MKLQIPIQIIQHLPLVEKKKNTTSLVKATKKSIDKFLKFL